MEKETWKVYLWIWFYIEMSSFEETVLFEIYINFQSDDVDTEKLQSNLQLRGAVVPPLLLSGMPLSYWLSWPRSILHHKRNPSRIGDIECSTKKTNAMAFQHLLHRSTGAILLLQLCLPLSGNKPNRAILSSVSFFLFFFLSLLSSTSEHDIGLSYISPYRAVLCFSKPIFSSNVDDIVQPPFLRLSSASCRLPRSRLR